MRSSRRFFQGAAALAAAGCLLLGPLTAAAQTVRLKYAPGVPLNNIAFERITKPWIEAINAAAQGEFRIDPVGPAVANATNVWERTINGVVDISLVVLGPSGQPFAKSNVTNLPGLLADDAAASVALWRLYEQGLLADEYKDVKVLALTAGPRLGLTATRPVTRLEDLQGAKVRAVGKVSADVLTALGASPIAVPFAEFYQSLSRNVIQGGMASFMSIVAFRSMEVARHHTFDVPLGMGPVAIVMNRRSYERLGPQARAVIDRHAGEQVSRELGAAWGRLDAEMRQQVQAEQGQTVHSLSEAERARWQRAVQPVLAQWAAQTPDGARLLETLKTEYAAALKKDR